MADYQLQIYFDGNETPKRNGKRPLQELLDPPARQARDSGVYRFLDGDQIDISVWNANELANDGARPTRLTFFFTQDPASRTGERSGSSAGDDGNPFDNSDSASVELDLAARTDRSGGWQVAPAVVLGLPQAEKAEKRSAGWDYRIELEVTLPGSGDVLAFDTDPEIIVDPNNRY